MALSKDDFLKKFPEFAETTPMAVVESRLQWAKDCISEEAFGSIYEQAVYQYTAHLIASSPNGVNARLNKQDGETIYSAEWNRIRSLHYKRGLPY